SAPTRSSWSRTATRRSASRPSGRAWARPWDLPCRYSYGREPGLQIGLAICQTIAMAEYTPDTALIVVDVQNDFADEDGALYVRGAEDLIPAINREIERALEAGALVIYSRDWHPEHTPHFKDYGGVWPVRCVGCSRGAEFRPDLFVA